MKELVGSRKACSVKEETMVFSKYGCGNRPH